MAAGSTGGPPPGGSSLNVHSISMKKGLSALYYVCVYIFLMFILDGLQHEEERSEWQARDKSATE
jgi:hypothetical protein